MGRPFSGTDYAKGKIEAWFSIKNNEVGLLENGNRVSEIEIKKYFNLG